MEKTFSIAAYDGLVTMARIEEIFGDPIFSDLSYVDPNFTHWGLDVPGVVTRAIEVKAFPVKQTHSLTKSAASELILSQHQIVLFCKNNTKWIKRQKNTLFIFKESNELFVAHAYFLGRHELEIHLDRFEEVGRASSLKGSRIIAPCS